MCIALSVEPLKPPSPDERHAVWALICDWASERGNNHAQKSQVCLVTPAKCQTLRGGAECLTQFRASVWLESERNRPMGRGGLYAAPRTLDLPTFALIAAEPQRRSMETFGNLFLTMLTIFFFVAYLMLLFFILTDLFRDKSLNGWWKAVWVLALIIFPILTALIYLIARGGSMQERAMAEAQEMKKAQDQYIQSVVSQQDPAEQIAKAKQLHEQGVIDDAEFEKLKAKALA